MYLMMLDGGMRFVNRLHGESRTALDSPGSEVFKRHVRVSSFAYELPERIASWVGAARGTITVSGENLATLWRAQTDAYGVGWVDPEISPNRSDAFGLGGFLGYIQESLPQSARIRTTVRLTF